MTEMHNSEKESADKDIDDLLLRSRPAVRMVSLITVYRIVTFPVIILLLLSENVSVAKWFLLASFTTDAIDGFLARRFNATSVLGAKLDSIGDDLTVLAATFGLSIFQFEFMIQQWIPLCILFGLFLVQIGLALFRYGKISTFHTYLAKLAAVITAVFLLSVYFFDHVHGGLFYAALIVTAIDLIEEIILVLVLPDYRSNVKGLYWVLKEKSR
jgi:CDP-diacylglycerol--glycerol-3-phosphate 3-phosphatidyltransferase